MASYVFNNTRTVTTGTEMFALAAADRIVLGSAAFWVGEHPGCVGISLQSGNNRVTIAGQIYTLPNAVFGLGGNDRVQVTQGGIVSSSTGSAIYLEGAFNNVQNDGHILGNQAVRFVDSGNSIVNSGTLFGAVGAALGFGDGMGADRVTNTGTINGYASFGVASTGSGTLTITNAGLISATFRSAISAENVASATIVNSGIIEAVVAIELGDGGDSVTNTGTINGTAILNAGNDLFDTSDGVMVGVVLGGDGDDAIIGSALRDRFDGGSGNDELTGNDGDDLLAGGAGADDLDGGAGSDTASYALATAVIVDLADAARNTGDALGDTFVSIENVLGGAGNDELSGDAAANRLRGGGGDDILDGRGGADRMIGGAGDDRYFIDDRGDRIVEVLGEGGDTAVASISFALPDFVEDLVLSGTTALSATGNVGANRVIGNAGANILDGLFGNDALTGGAGADQFRFTTPLDASANVDTILDFTPGTDRIALSRTIFNPLGGGSAGVQAAAFVTGTTAADANDRIIHDSATGRIFYDPDGTGALAQTLFARVNSGLVLSATDFLVFG